jgi:simple sugar transport system permease protein
MRQTWFTDQHIRFLCVAVILIVLIASLLSSGQFLDPLNFQSMATQLPEVALLALGIMLTMISGNGGIDLSVVATANLSAVIAGKLCLIFFPGDQNAMAFTVCFVLFALVVGMICGLVNGLLISRSGFPPILATLGTQLVFFGFATVITGGPSVSFGYTEAFSALGNGQILGVPVPFLVFAIVAALIAWILTNTRFGFRLYLTGTNAKAAHFTGIDNKTVLLLTYTISGLVCALSGIISASRASSVKADYGSSYLLISILIAVMGGVNPSGGHGKVLGVVLSAIALQMLSSTLNLIGASNFLKDFLWGLILLASIAFTSGQLVWRKSKSISSATPS